MSQYYQSGSDADYQSGGSGDQFSDDNTYHQTSYPTPALNAAQISAKALGDMADAAYAVAGDTGITAVSGADIAAARAAAQQAAAASAPTPPWLGNTLSAAGLLLGFSGDTPQRQADYSDPFAGYSDNGESGGVGGADFEPYDVSGLAALAAVGLYAYNVYNYSGNPTAGYGSGSGAAHPFDSNDYVPPPPPVNTPSQSSPNSPY